MDINSVMMLVGLVKEFGPKVGRFLNEKINSDENKRKVFLEGIAKNEEIKSILKKIFADKYDLIMKEAQKIKKIRYESHYEGYISLPIDKTLSKNEINDLLKAELSENLERLESETNDIDKTEFMNKASFIVTTWMKKFIELRNPDEQTIKKLKVLHEILKPGKLTAKDIFKKLKPLFGLGSALTIIYTAMLATTTGLGIWAKIITYLGGIPVGQIFALASVGLILGYLTLIPINETDKVQIVINGLYGVLDENIEDFAELIKREKENIQIQDKERELLFELERKLSQKIPNEIIHSIVSLLKYLILIDNDEHSTEKLSLINFLKENYDLSDTEITNFYQNSNSIENVETFLKDLFEILDDNEKEKLIGITKKIVIADGQLHENEINFIKLIEKNFRN